MGIIIKESIKSSIAAYVGIIIGVVNVILLYTKFLSPSQLGLTRVLQDTTLLIVSFAQLGTPFVIIKFYPQFKNKAQGDYGFLTLAVVYALSGFIMFSVLFFLFHSYFINLYASKSPLLLSYYYLIVPFVGGLILLNLFESYIIAHTKVFFPTLIREVLIKLFNMILIILFSLKFFSFSNYLLLSISIYFIGAIILIFYIKKLGILFIKPKLSIFKTLKFGSILNYGAFTILGGIGYMLATKIDVIMLPAYRGLRKTAIYVIAIFIASLLEIPKRMLSKASVSTLNFAFKNNDTAQIEELYKKTSINLFLAGSFIVIIIWSNINDFFYIIPKGEIYAGGKIVLFIFLIGKLFDLLSGINNEIILYSKYYKYTILFILFLGMMTVVTNVIFIPKFGITGAALATFISVFIYMVVKIIFVYKKFNIHPFQKETFKMIFVLLIFLLAAIQLNYLSENFSLNNLIGIDSGLIFHLSNIFIKSGILFILFLFTVVKLNISDDFSLLIYKYIKKFKIGN